MQHKPPLISVICPTHAGREKHLERLIEYFFAQYYPRKELIIVTDDLRMSIDHEEKGCRVCYVNNGYTGIKTVGAKRNIACAHAFGEIIVHGDSDDYYAPDWITKSVEHLIQSGADLTGLSSAYFYKPHSNMWDYVWQGGQPYILEATMCYWKKTWVKRCFEDTSNGEGRVFCANAGIIKPHTYKDGFIAMVHGGNTASQHTIPHMKPINTDIAKPILGKDYKKYPI